MWLVSCYVDLGLALFWWCRRNTNTVITVQNHAGSQCGAMSKSRACRVLCKQTQTDLQKDSWTCCISFSFAFGFLWQVTSLTHRFEPFSRKLHSIMCSLCMLSAGIITLTDTFSECDPVAALFSKQWLNDCPPLTCLPVLCSPRTTSVLVYQNSCHCSTLAGIEKLWMNKKQQKKWQNVEFNQKVCSQRNLKFLASWQFWMLSINDP